MLIDANISVLGGGSWGTTLANLLADKGYRVRLWVFEEDLCKIIDEERENVIYLPGIRLSNNIIPTNSLKEAVKEADVIVSVIPSAFVRNIMEKIAPLISSNSVILSASKGIENETFMTMSQVIGEIIPNNKNIASLSGPSFAKEVSEKKPTAVSIASNNNDIALLLQKNLSTPYFRVYTTDDIIGVEFGGALKNIIAIAAGIVDGLSLGNNAKASLITRGLMEIVRIGVRMGANPETFFGLSGLGDLVLTCTGNLSRNRGVGLKIGKGMRIKDILDGMKMVAEGIYTTKATYNLANRLNIETPIIKEVYHILYDNKSPKDALTDLMNRNLKEEFIQVF
jgi:glycerol-3-phosphate dehydrogenase (NAD(P)+)